jgi:hypothetical protein
MSAPFCRSVEREDEEEKKATAVSFICAQV